MVAGSRPRMSSIGMMGLTAALLAASEPRQRVARIVDEGDEPGAPGIEPTPPTEAPAMQAEAPRPRVKLTAAEMRAEAKRTRKNARRLAALAEGIAR